MPNVGWRVRYWMRQVVKLSECEEEDERSSMLKRRKAEQLEEDFGVWNEDLG